MRDDLDALQAKLGHRFGELARLETALVHRSFANENQKLGLADNEKLEFLGDAVLDLVVGHLLMTRFPQLNEGELSVTRAQVVSEAGLAEVAREIELGKWLQLGKGEERGGGRDKPSLLADAFEAVIAAIYLDAGFARAFEIVENLFTSRIARVEFSGFYDHKTRLQELTQSLLRVPPTYEVVEQRGPDHARVFLVAAFVNGKELARAEGRSKKEAEQRAAEAGAFLLQGGDWTAFQPVEDAEKS